MKKIDSKRLCELREHAGLSQAALASRLGVDTSLISRWEKGSREPSLAQSVSLARVLGVTLDYLLNAKMNVHFRFRAKKTLIQEELSAIDRALVNAEMQIYYLDTSYRLAKKLPQPFTLKVDFFQEQLPVTAQQLRDHLKLNQRITLEELKQALTERNVHIFEWSMPWELSGLSFRDAHTVIFINRIHAKERRLFTLAHEFGHVVFHLGRDHQNSVVSTIASNRDPMEKEANLFAAEFLMPQNMLESVLKNAGDKIKSIEVLDSIARYFNVSRDAIFYRLADKNIFSWEEKRLYFSKSKPVQNIPETRINEINEQVSSEFLRTALELFDDEKISSGKLCDWFFTDRLTIDEYLALRVQEAEEVFEF